MTRYLAIAKATFLLFIVASRLTRDVAGAVTKDKFDNCTDLVKKGGCRADPDNMRKNCHESCAKWEEEVGKVQTRRVVEGDPSFFELKAKNSTGSVIRFERFEGYITIVANMAKKCQENMAEKTFQAMESIHDVWPYTLEILIFTFEHNDIPYDDLDCTEHNVAVRKTGRRVYAMEEVHINGPETHPVYKYLKDLFDIKDLEDNFATFFLISPDGDTVEVHRAASMLQLKNYIRQHLKRDL